MTLPMPAGSSDGLLRRFWEAFIAFNSETSLSDDPIYLRHWEYIWDVLILMTNLFDQIMPSRVSIIVLAVEMISAAA